VGINPTKLSTQDAKRCSIDVWALGITVVIGGQYFGWNFGLVAGVGGFMVVTIIVGSAYLCLVLCLAEISSGIPFAGGSFALTRCMIGFYAGFIIGSCEALEYITYVASATLALSNMIIHLFDLNGSMQPVLCLLFYVSATLVHIRGGDLFWRVNLSLAVISLLFLLLYCAVVVGHVNISKYGGISSASDVDTETMADTSIHIDRSLRSVNNWFDSDFRSYAVAFPLSTWFYVGVESLGFVSNDVINPKTTIPRGFVASVITLLCTSVLVLLICASSYPGVYELTDIDDPLSAGYSRGFGVNKASAVLFTIPATYATGFGFMYGYGKILDSMAQSNLYPRQLQYKYGPNNTPIVAIITGSVISMSLCFLAYILPVINSFIFQLCILFGIMSYICQCISYLILHKNYKAKFDFEFRNPLGRYGAIYAATVFTLVGICVVGFQETQVAFYACVVIIMILSCYYYTYVVSRQVLSNDETALIFTKLVLHRNLRAMKAIKNQHRRNSFEHVKSLILKPCRNMTIPHSASNTSKLVSIKIPKNSQIHPIQNEVIDLDVEKSYRVLLFKMNNQIENDPSGKLEQDTPVFDNDTLMHSFETKR